MANKILVIEHIPVVSESSCLRLIHEPARCEHWMWGDFDPAALFQSKAQLVVACPVPGTDKVAPFFRWLGKNPIAVPVLAILPESSDQDLLRSVSEVTDDFLFSPPREQELNLRIARILGEHPKNDERIRPWTCQGRLSQLVGNHPSFLEAVERVRLFGRTHATVFISGETGTGKELFAHAIHSLGPRQSGPFIPVDCGALPEHLAENELFGHRRGAFTDAHTDQTGLAAMADGGTLFLDEVDALSLPNQAKLLRFLQEGTYRALGADHFTRSNVRVMAASNQNIEGCVRQGRFRGDLYFRLNVLRLHLPPLRERGGDVALLARYFLENECNSKTERKLFSNCAIRKLQSHNWPGNVRELFNTVQRAFLHSLGRQITSTQISFLDGAATECTTSIGNMKFRAAKQQVIEKFERTYLVELLARHQGNVTQAAREAGKERRALGRMAKKYGLGPRTFADEADRAS